MRDYEELKEQADILMETIILFNSRAGVIESRLSLNLWHLERSMQAVVDHVDELVYEQKQSDEQYDW